MDGAIPEVDQFLRMSDGPVRAAATFMAIVGAGDGVAAAQGSAKEAVLMAPAQPPLPSCRCLAFQADAAGSQANLILESRLGRMTPRTSQWAGTPDPPAAHPERRAPVRRLPARSSPR